MTFSPPSTFEGVTEWLVYVDGEPAGALTRERPMRWHANGVGGLVRDHDRPWIWLCDLGIEIPDGTGARAVKTIVRDHLTPSE